MVFMKSLKALRWRSKRSEVPGVRMNWIFMSGLKREDQMFWFRIQSEDEWKDFWL